MAQLGEILLAQGLITTDQLSKATEVHVATGKMLGRVLVDEELGPKMTIRTITC